ncbi:hypothetical protein [Oceanospirillum multiglobuliferum]|uniref:Uncharacterized protein n=1 Tax=Oceanospirillum multiglobuliferum TaxID=64969 RepID=A0A1V4T6A4_9GAMM|nr:hypothetical protein [Oceanospirillum multiglobuliferum]OPX56135.1 hypothetical protein BTE48_06225 [Oceanospirillum multiglobuliferum]
MDIRNTSSFLSTLTAGSASATTQNRLKYTPPADEGINLKEAIEGGKAYQEMQDQRHAEFRKIWGDNFQNVFKLARSAEDHLSTGFQGFESFKEKQAIEHPNIDIDSLDVALEDGQLKLSALDVNGQPISDKQLASIEEDFLKEEELVESLTLGLSEITESIAHSTSEFFRDYDLEFSREGIVKDGRFSLNDLVQEYNQSFEKRYKDSNERERERERDISKGIDKMIPTTEKYSTFSERLERGGLEVFATLNFAHERPTDPANIYSLIELNA